MNRRRPGEGNKNEFRVDGEDYPRLMRTRGSMIVAAFNGILREGCRDDLDNTAFSNRYSLAEAKQYNFLDKADQNHRDACQRPSPLEAPVPRQKIFSPPVRPWKDSTMLSSHSKMISKQFLCDLAYGDVRIQRGRQPTAATVRLRPNGLGRLSSTM